MDPLFPIIYFILVVISLLAVNSVSREIAKKMPSLVDTQWKRMLWLVSCLFFLPVFFMTVKFPIFLWDEIREFIVGDKKNSKTL